VKGDLTSSLYEGEKGRGYYFVNIHSEGGGAEEDCDGEDPTHRVHTDTDDLFIGLFSFCCFMCLYYFEIVL